MSSGARTNYLGCPNGKNPTWECQCSCGTVLPVMVHHLTGTEPRRSCGCLKRELMQGTSLVCRSCKVEKPIDQFYGKGRGVLTRHSICIPCHQRHLNQQLKVRTRRYKMHAISHYSNGLMKCACCGEAHIEFLTIDHIDGGGNTHRKSQLSGIKIHRWLHINRYPAGFRVLCSNCNMAYGAFGYCPHVASKPPDGWVASKKRPSLIVVG